MTFKTDEPVYAGPLPKSLERFRANIVDVSDERAYDQGYWVYLRRGLQSDPRSHTHCVHEDTITECVRAFKWVCACDCQDCAPEGERYGDQR